MLDPWDCEDRGWNKWQNEIYDYSNSHFIRRKYPKNKKENNDMNESRSYYASKRELYMLDLDKFLEFYNLKVEERFYIYDQIERRYITTISQPRDGVLSYKPALMKVSEKARSLDIVDYVDDVRSFTEIRRLLDATFTAIMNEFYVIKSGKLDETLVRYKIIKIEYMGSAEFKKNSYIEYTDEIDESKSIEDINRSICQLYKIFPGRKFYIYNIEEKTFRSTKVQEIGLTRIVPIVFTYENNIITSEKTNEEDYARIVFKRIYNDFFIAKTGATKYRLVREDLMKKTDLAGSVIFNDDVIKAETSQFMTSLVEIKLSEYNIKKEGNSFVHFFLRTCAIDKNSLNVLTKREGNSLILIEFMYSTDDGLVATNVDILDVDIAKLHEMESQIVTGELTPIDIDEWNEEIERKQRLDITLEKFDIK